MPAELPLATKKGTPIRNSRRMEGDPTFLRTAVAEVDRIHPEVTLRSISVTYNCFGMVFASRRTWIYEPPMWQLILDEDGYFKLPPGEPATVGDVVIYREGGAIAHVGVVLRVGPKPVTGELEYHVLSKWGAIGEYIHELADVPASYGTEHEFWTERKTPA